MIFCQKDPKWANQRLGTCNGSTIGGAGCYVTSLAQILYNRGYNHTPKTLDDFFTRRAYHSGCLLNEYVLPKWFDEFELLGVYHCESFPCDLEQLKKKECEEHIVCVDSDRSPGRRRTHFMRLHEYDGHNVMVDDPMRGKRVNLADYYGKPETAILKIIKYRYTGKEKNMKIEVVKELDIVKEGSKYRGWLLKVGDEYVAVNETRAFSESNGQDVIAKIDEGKVVVTSGAYEKLREIKAIVKEVK